MKKHISYIFVLIFFSSLLAGTDVFREYGAQPESNKVIISWVTLNESEIHHFVIKRSNDNQSSYIELGQVASNGPGYNYVYEDENVFFKNSGVVYYLIEALNSNGLVIESTNTMFVHPSISGLHKTWGEIKNIFR